MSFKVQNGGFLVLAVGIAVSGGFLLLSFLTKSKYRSIEVPKHTGRLCVYGMDGWMDGMVYSFT